MRSDRSLSLRVYTIVYYHIGYTLMPSDEGDVYAFLSLGFGAGLYSFFKGFRVYREYRVLEDTL